MQLKLQTFLPLCARSLFVPYHSAKASSCAPTLQLLIELCRCSLTPPSGKLTLSRALSERKRALSSKRLLFCAGRWLWRFLLLLPAEYQYQSRSQLRCCYRCCRAAFSSALGIFVTCFCFYS